jgi:hypothetical protein
MSNSTNERPGAPSAGKPARINLKTYSGDLSQGTLTVGVDNIHFDVFLSPVFVEFARAYLLDLIRQTANLTQFSGVASRPFRAPETSVLRKHLTELMQASLTRAKYEKNIELDLLLRVSLLKFLTQEIGNQFANLVLEGKEWIRHRGAVFEHSEQGHVMKARLAELQASRRNVYRQVGQQVYQVLLDVEENMLCKSRRALFGEEKGEPYDLLKNRLVFVEGGKDDVLYLEQYVLLGNYLHDQDRFETIEALFLDFLREFILAGDQGAEMSEQWKNYHTRVDAALATRAELARLEEEKKGLLRRLEGGDGFLSRLVGSSDPATLRATLADVERRHRHLQQKLEALGSELEAAKHKADFLTAQYQSRLGDYLNDPENARRLFDPQWAGEGDTDASATRSQLLEEWVNRLEQRELLVHVLASYELRNLYHDYCPPVHLQQLKKTLVFREELKHVEDILKQFPAKRFSLQRIEDLARKLRRYPRDEARAVAVRFAEDFMRLHRDLRDLQRLSACMERINLIRTERTRELSRLNSSLYEFLLPEEGRPAEDRVVSHAVIKADVRGSTQITRDLLARGLNPASHLSLNLYEPVKRILDRFGAAKVFIEGDAIVMAIFESESNRSHQHAVSKACLLARQILAVSQAYNDRAEASDLPRLELGLGVAYQGSPPTFWMDSDSRIMISRALNLSDRLSSCSKVARRLLAKNPSLFKLFLFQTVMEGTSEEEADEFLIRFNLNGVELNDEGFQKLTEEISLSSVETDCVMPWGRERVTFYCGEAPIGEALEPIVIRKGLVRQLLPDGKIGAVGTHAYYEVCTSPKVFDMVEAQVGSEVRKV